MSRKPERKKLGRGLSALIGDIPDAPVVPQPAEERPEARDRGPVASLPIDLLRPNPEQPRRHFDEAELSELSDSIRQRGVIQPVIVRPDPENPELFQIVAGERRWRAAQRAQLHELPVVIRPLTDQEVFELALIENIQRADLNPLEEALAYSKLIERLSYTQEELARIVGKSRPHLANTLRLLTLPPGIQEFLRAGKLTAGHARALIGAADPDGLAMKAVNEGLTVRQVEALARKLPPNEQSKPSRAPAQKDADTRLLEGDLSAAIGMKVRIDHAADGGGEVRIRYGSLEDLDRLCQALAD
ncbi:MAG: ParB/RepB/Spo0J family partition protein [Pseudomonadota bacterium]